jgi:hypothetical protein
LRRRLALIASGGASELGEPPAPPSPSIDTSAAVAEGIKRQQRDAIARFQEAEIKAARQQGRRAQRIIGTGPGGLVTDGFLPEPEKAATA